MNQSGKRLFRGFAIICFLFLAACGGAPAPTAEPGLVSAAPSAPPPAPPATQTLTQRPSVAASPTQSRPTQTNTALPTKTTARRPLLPTPTQVMTATPAAFTPVARENTAVPQPGAPIGLDNVQQVAELARWGKGAVKDMAYSPDGSLLAVATSLGVYFYDNQQALVDAIETDEAVEHLAFSKKGDLMVIGSPKGKLMLWNWKEKRFIKAFITAEGTSLMQLEISPAGDTIGYISLPESNYTQELIFLNTADGAILRTWPVSFPAAFQYAPNGQSIYLSSGAVEKIRLADGVVETRWQMPEQDHQELANNVDISSDEKTMIVSDSYRIYLWHPEEPAPYYSFESKDDYYNSHFFFKADTCYFFADGGGDTQYIYSFAPDNQTLVVLGENGTLQVRRVRDGALIAATPEKNKPGQTEIYSAGLAFHPQRPEFAVRYSTGPIDIMDLNGMTVRGTISGHTSEFNALAFSPAVAGGPAYLAAGASDNLTRIWNLNSGQRALDLDVLSLSLAFSKDGKYLMRGSKDWSFALINLVDGRQVGPVNGHKDWVSGVAMTADRKTLITGSYDCTLRIWDVQEDGQNVTITPRKVLGGTEESHLSQVREMRLSGDETWALGIHFLDVFRYNLKTGQLDTETDINAVGIDLAPDGRSFATGWVDLKIVDIETLKIINTFAIIDIEENIRIDEVAYAPDGRLIAAGTDSGLIHFVDAQTGKILLTVQGHRGEVVALRFSPDGRYLASAARDGTLKLWGLP